MKPARGWILKLKKERKGKKISLWAIGEAGFNQVKQQKGSTDKGQDWM